MAHNDCRCQRHREIDEMQARHDAEQDLEDLAACPPVPVHYVQNDQVPPDMDVDGTAIDRLGARERCDLCRRPTVVQPCAPCQWAMDGERDEDRYRSRTGLWG